MSWLEIAALPLGLTSAWGYVRFSRRFGARQVVVLAGGLVCAALIYVAAALVVGTAQAVLLELAGLAPFGMLATLGVRRAPAWLAAGWALRVAWDLAAQAAADPVLPLRYAIACLGFDAVIATAIVQQARVPAAAGHTG